MDQLTAHKILGLAPGSSPEEIKEAYAALSRQYHPEEAPEKFQEIHEAYVTLTRRKRRENIENKIVEDEPTFNGVEVQPDVSVIPEYSFEQALQKANQKELEKSHELVLEAAAELKILVSPKYKKQLKAYKSFFEDQKYGSIIKRADFLEKLCDILEETKLKKNIYDYMIEFYRLRGMDTNELSPIGLRLYQILDAKAGVKKNVNPGVYGGIAAGLIAGIRALRPVIRQNDFLALLALGIIVTLFIIWIYKKIPEKRSILFAQIVISIGLMISQFVVIMFDLYGTAFGTVDDGNSVAAVIFLIASLWLFIVIVIAIIKAVAGLIKKK